MQQKCYPGSGARMTLDDGGLRSPLAGTYRKCVDLFLAPSQFVRDKFVEHGWDGGKFEVLPHFQDGPYIGDARRCPGSAQCCILGRLSAEKGVDDLLRAMQTGFRRCA